VTTYVLGAGASHHAGYPLASRLGAELFDWISHVGPGFQMFRPSVEMLHELYGGLEDFEQILTELDECAPNSRAATLKSTERGFIRQALEHSVPGFFNQIRGQPAPLYGQLASQRVKQGDVILTFNYDVACESSLKKAGLWEINDGYGFNLGIDTIPASKVKILKLHGSTNWWGPIFNGMRGGFWQGGPTALPPRPVILFSHDFGFLGYSEDLRDHQYSGASDPAVKTCLILPTHHKRFFVATSGGQEWGNFWNELWSQAADSLYASDHIVIIGYSLPLADREARALLFEKSNKRAALNILCGSKSNRICEDFRSRGFSRVETDGTGRFEDFLASPL
jgi:hypothetical protein